MSCERVRDGMCTEIFCAAVRCTCRYNLPHSDGMCIVFIVFLSILSFGDNPVSYPDRKSCKGHMYF